MALEHRFIDMEIADITRIKDEKLVDGWRAVQILCTTCDDGLEVVYSYTKGDVLENYIVHGVKKEDEIPSITDAFIGMFPFENEARELFGLNVKDIAIDFDGNFYDLAQPEPMTILSAEKIAAKEKAAKVAAAKAAAAAKRAAAAKAKEAGEAGAEAPGAGEAKADAPKAQEAAPAAEAEQPAAQAKEGE